MSVLLPFVAIVATGCKLPFLGGGSGDSSASTASLLSAPDADGIYGVSPRTIKVAQSTSLQYPSYAVYSANTAGDVRLSTDFASGWIAGMLPNVSYDLRVYGLDGQYVRSTRPLAEYSVRTWKGFDRAPLTLTKIDGARYSVGWVYSPWTSLPAGRGILDATRIRCGVKQGAGSTDDPFSGGKLIEGPLTDGRILVDALALGMTGTVLIGCEAIFADQSIDVNPTRLSFTPTIHLAPCASTAGVQDQTYSCDMAFLDDAGNRVASGATLFEVDPSQNTCGFLKPVDASGAVAAAGLKLSGKPNDNQVGTCTLAYRIQGSSTDLVMAQEITIANVQPKFLTGGNPARPVAEDAVVTTDGGYALVLDDRDVETDEEVAGRNASTVFGTYSETRTSVSIPCSNYGSVKIDPLTGRTLFKPEADYYGVCTIGIQYDDGNTASGNNLAVRTVPVRVLARNDAPAITDGPGQLVNSVRVENCGDHCYIGAEYDFNLGTHPGGGKYVELDQTLSLLKCAPDSASTRYIQVTYCAFDPKSKQLQLSFAPLAVMPGGAQPKITVQIRDDGYDEQPTGGYDATGLALVTKVPNPLKSAEFTFAVDVAQFTQNFKPAVAVSEAGCVACHANVTGDFFTDFGFGHASTQGSFWTRTDAVGAFVMGDQTVSGYGHGYNTLDALSGLFYVPRKTVPQPTANGTASSPYWKYNFGVTSAFPAPATLAQLLSQPGRVEKLTNDYMPTGVDPANYASIRTLMNPSLVSKVTDTFVANGVSKVIKDITIDYPTSADLKAIDHRNRIDWTSASAQFAYLGGSPVVNGVTLFSGLVIRSNAGTTMVANDPAAGGVVRCIGDVLVKGPLVFYGATLQTSAATPCRLHVDGPVFIAGAPGQAYGLTVTAAPGAPVGTVQVTSSQGIILGMGPSALLAWKTWLGDTAIQLGTAATQLGLTDARFDGCGGAPLFYCDTRYLCTSAGGIPVGTNDPSACTGPVTDRGTAFTSQTFQFTHLMLNAPTILSRYRGKFQGAVVAGFATFRLSDLTYVYDDALASDVPYPRLRSLRTDARPAGLSVFDVLEQ